MKCDKIRFLKFMIKILIIMYIMYGIKLYIINFKEHMEDDNENKKKKKKKKKAVFGSYTYIANKGSTGGNIGNITTNVGLVAAGLGYGIYLVGDLAKYLIYDVPKEMNKLVDGGGNDPISSIFG